MIYTLNQMGLKPVKDYTCDTDQPCAFSLNPKGFDSRRALAFRQDRPSLTAGINETNVYTAPILTHYHAGSPYGSQKGPARAIDERYPYAAWTAFPAPKQGQDMNQRYRVNNAQVQYYVDESLQTPYPAPAFQMPSESQLDNYVDPMGEWKPHYPLSICAPQRYSCLSWLNDSSFWREDLMARQQAVHNQQQSLPFFKTPN